MPQRITSVVRADLGAQFAQLRDSVGAPGTVDAVAALAELAVGAGDLALASSCAGAAVLIEHVEWAGHRHAPRMLAVLATLGPGAVSAGPDGLFAAAGAAVAHDYGVLPSWPAPDIGMLMERALRAPVDVALALACALAEVCERNGLDGEFAALHAQMAAIERQPAASPFWLGQWSIACAWHLHSFGTAAEVAQRLKLAQSIAATHGLHRLGATAALQRARLVESWRAPAQAIALADAALVHDSAVDAPLWWADHADVRCRIALSSLDFHAAVGHARRAIGHARAAAVWPGYRVPYCANEAYALLGTGAVDEALACFRAIGEIPMPRYQSARLHCLTNVVALTAADRHGEWTAKQQTELAMLMRRLRELEWPSVLPTLPEMIARLFARALAGGIEVDWVCAAIRTRALAAPRGAPEAWPWPVLVRTLGPFEVVTASGPLRQASGEARKASSKPLELLRYISAYGHDAVPVDVVAAALWTGDGREGRQKAFDVTVARLRRLLGHDAAIGVSDRRVRLAGQCVWTDVQALNDRLAEGEAAPEGSIAACDALEATLALYRGPFLADSRESWVEAARSRLRSRVAAALLRATRHSAIDASRRREWMLRAAAADPRVAELIGAV